MSLAQNEFDYLIKLEKQFLENDAIYLDSKWSRSIVSIQSKDSFIIDYYIGSIQITKFTYNKRFRKIIPLLRFDSCGRHTNPDGITFDGPHVHIYRESYDDKFAFPVSEIGVDENDLDKSNVLKKFLEFCNVKNYPNIQTTLF